MAPEHKSMAFDRSTVKKLIDAVEHQGWVAHLPHVGSAMQVAGDLLLGAVALIDHIEALAKPSGIVRPGEALDAILACIKAGQPVDACDTRPLEEWEATGDLCSECDEPQFKTPSGPVCKNGHGGAPPK